MNLTPEDQADIAVIEAGGEISERLYEKTLCYLMDNGEIPYGTAKARDGDPYEFCTKYLLGL